MNNRVSPFITNQIPPQLPHFDVVFVAEMIAGCSWYRLKTPGEALNDIGYKTIITNKLTPQYLHTSDLFVFLRPGSEHNSQMMDTLKQMGKTVVVDFDDNLWNISHSNPAFHGWNQSEGKHLNILTENIQKADFITTTTQSLADYVSRYNKNVHILPNMLPDKYWSKTLHKFNTESPITVGWAGSTSHVSDLALLNGVVETILDKYPHVRFVFTGITPTKAQHERLEVWKFVDIKEYPQTIAKFDIALAPVTDTLFNHGKSDLKFLESAATGIPTIASNTITYDSLQIGIHGFKAKNTKDWIKFISRLIEDTELRKQMGINSREFAETRMASKNAHLWEAVYGLNK